MNKITKLFVESAIPAIKVGYHTTLKENTDSILRDGLKVNPEQKGFTNGSNWVIDAYGMIPIYMTTDGGYKLAEYENSSLFQVDCTGLNIGADLGTLIEHGATLEENGFFFQDEYRVPPYFSSEELWSYDALTNDQTFIENSIALTKTFTVLQDIPPDRIKLVSDLNESPILNNYPGHLDDQDSIVGTGITRMEQLQRRYHTSKTDWDFLGKETVYAGNTIEWFKDEVINQVRGFMFTPKHEPMGMIAGAMPKLTKYPNFLGVHLVFLFKPYQGKGNGLSLYQNAIEKFGGIVSDSTLTKASLGVWKSLSKKYPTYWYKFPQNPDAPGRVLIPISGNDLDNSLLSTDEEFVMSKTELLDD